MVVVSNPGLEEISLVKVHRSLNSFTRIPTVDISEVGNETILVRACEELGFFKVINHGVSAETIARLEAEAEKFFCRPQFEKERSGQNKFFHYGNRTIGHNGDAGWLEYILTHTISGDIISAETAVDHLLCYMKDYIAEVRGLACQVLEMMATGLRSKQRDVLSRMVMAEESDSVFRVNYYPPCPVVKGMIDYRLTGFGEHTDPQILSVLRSNNTNGLQISLRDGRWVSIPPDRTSFYIFVGDSLQVLTNGRFRSVRHRVLANSQKPRVSMIYFGGPPGGQKIAPLRLLMGEEEEESIYKEFTWSEYKNSAFKSRLADDRLLQFVKRI